MAGTSFEVGEPTAELLTQLERTFGVRTNTAANAARKAVLSSTGGAPRGAPSPLTLLLPYLLQLFRRAQQLTIALFQSPLRCPV
jgi:hypothetical protein